MGRNKQLRCVVVCASYVPGHSPLGWSQPRHLSTGSYDTDQTADQHARSLLRGRKSSPRYCPRLAMLLMILLIAIRLHRCDQVGSILLSFIFHSSTTLTAVSWQPNNIGLVVTRGLGQPQSNNGHIACPLHVSTILSSCQSRMPSRSNQFLHD